MTKKQHPEDAPNVLEMVPRHAIDFIEQDDRVIILLPKFKSNILKKHLLPRMKSPHNKIHLDEFGTFIWKYIDGKRQVKDIAPLLREEFGKDIEPVYERLGMFINMLAQRKLIELQ